MTCAACAEAARDPSSPIFHAGCPQCERRAMSSASDLAAGAAGPENEASQG